MSPTALILSAALALSTLPAVARVETHTTAGRSMLPTLPAERTEIAVDTDPAGFDRLTPGAVIVYRLPCGQGVTHRLFRQIAPGVWWARGDANPLPDPVYVTRENYVGRVVTPLPPSPLAKRRVARAMEGMEGASK